MKNSQICNRLDKLKAERSTVEQQWYLKEKFVLGTGDSIYNDNNTESEVDWRNRDVYDSTAVVAAQALASSVQSDMTSPALKWFDFKFRNKELNKDEAAKEWLEMCRDLVHDEFQEGNFNVEMSEAFTALTGIGTTVVVAEVDEEEDGSYDGINYQTIPTTEIFFDENHKKELHAMYRLLKWTPLQMITKFGEEGVPAKIKEKYERGENDKEDVIFAIYHRKDAKKVEDSMAILAPKLRPIGFKYVLRNGKETLGEEGGYYEMPAYVARWTRVQGSKYGMCPADHIMGDILTLNELVQVTMESIGKVVDPAWLIEERSIIEDLDQARSQLNVVKDINGLKPMESGAQFNPAMMEIDRLQTSIKEAFFVNKMELKESPAMTATEVNARLQRMFKAMSTIVTRIEKELLDPIIERSFNIMLRAKQLPPAPESIDLGKMDIEYTGPLPKLMRSEKAQSIMGFMDWVSQHAQIFPEMLDYVNPDDGIKEIALAMGIPASMRRTKEEVEQIRKQRAEQQAQAQQMEQMQAMASAMKDGGAGAKSLDEAGMMEEMQ